MTLLDRTNHHCFQPLLYQVATGSLSPGEIGPPFRWIFRHQRNVEVHMAEVHGIDLAARRVDADVATGSDAATGRSFTYDHLVVATGSRHSYFGNDQWEAFAPGLKTIEDALELRHRIFSAFERADIATDDAQRRRLLTFVIVGAGPTGVELAGQVIEIARSTVRREYRRFDPADACVLLVDAAPRVLGAFDERLSAKARSAMESMGIEVRTDAAVSLVDADGVMLGDERIQAGTIIWAAGVQASALAGVLEATTHAQLDRRGRVLVQPDFSLPDFPRVRVIGDLASTDMPGVAPPAMQQGEWVARSIDAFERRTAPPKPFRYRDKGSIATIGKRRAVAKIHGLRLGGTIAWLTWLVVHLLYLVGFANRVQVTIRWVFSYFAGGRGERVLTRQFAPGAPPRLDAQPDDPTT